MKKIFILLITIFNYLFSYNYDNLLIDAQVKLYPKLILLDKRISQKKYNNTISFTIVYHDSDIEKALQIKNKINKIYKGKLNNFSFFIDTKNFTEVDNINASAIYLLKGNKQQIKQACLIAQKKQIPVFSYDINDLKYGSLLSLYIQNTPIIYFNNKIHKKYNIEFFDTFYQIVRFIDE